MTAAKKKREEKEAREAAWRAEEDRIRKLGEAFEAIPNGPEKMALQEAMTDRIIELYNNVKFEEGDAILEFLPNEYARRLLDWYFDDTDTVPRPMLDSQLQTDKMSEANERGA